MSSALETQPEIIDTIGVVTTSEQLAELAGAWRMLGAQAGGPIEQYEWAAAIAANVQRVGSVRIVTLSQAEQLVALAALEVKRLAGVPRRLMLGLDWHHEPMDLLARDSQSLKSLIAALAADGWPYVFARMPTESPSVAAIRNAFAEESWIVERPQAAYPYISLDTSWETPEQHLNSGRRSDLRRAQRKAEKLGPVIAEVLSPQPFELDALLDEALEIEARSWKGIAGTALACEPIEAAFCRDYARGACQEGILRFCRLRIGDRTVATQIAMVQAGSFWLLKIGYDAEFSSCSPGMLLLRESIAYAARTGLSSFEFLGQTEPWIEVWTSHKRPCVGLRVYPHNLHGAAALAADATVYGCGRAWQRARTDVPRIRGLVKACAMPLVKRAARNYIAGETLADAQSVLRRLAGQGLAGTIGFWDTDEQSARMVADQYLAGLDALAQEDRSTYLSIKLPSLRFSPELLGEVVQRARDVGRRIHFDAMAPETADRTQAMIDDVLAATPYIEIGVTLPGRWKRSLDDAQWVAQRGLFVRVVKGEWADPLDPQRDLRSGYLETIDQLAGKARWVGVATHDPVLAAEAIRRLQAAGTPCGLELLYGLPMRKQIEQASKLGVGVRIYVPYGEAYMPYALSQVRRKPRILWWLLRDLVASWVAPRQV